MQVSIILDSIFGVPKTLGSIYGGQQGNSGMDPPVVSPVVLKVREYPPGPSGQFLLDFQSTNSVGILTILLWRIIDPSFCQLNQLKFFDAQRIIVEISLMPSRAVVYFLSMW